MTEWEKIFAAPLRRGFKCRLRKELITQKEKHTQGKMDNALELTTST